MAKKLVDIYLNSIAYSGGNIGRDLSVNIDIDGWTHTFNIQLKNGQTRDFSNKLLLQSIQTSSSLTLPTHIKITERDRISSDYGESQSTLSSSINSENETQSVAVEVQGQGWDKKRKAHFSLGFTIFKRDAIRYVTDQLPHGWLKVKFDQSGKTVPLPQGLKVEITQIENGREYFKILEGHYKGYNASVVQRKDRDYLTTSIMHKEPIQLIFYQAERRLVIPGLGNYKIEMLKANEIPIGTYDLEIPDDPKHIDDNSASYYKRFSRFAKSWFRIGNEGDRYLHMGRRSAGCITVIEKERWTEIYEYLIFRRKNSTAVSTVKVQ